MKRPIFIHTITDKTTLGVAAVQIPLLLPFFFTIELTRAALWAVRAVDEPDRDGPLLRALFALLVGALSVVPRPVWTLVTYVVWVAWVPVRGVLWVWGIGRGDGKKRSPRAVSRWYAHTRERREKVLRGKRKSEYEYMYVTKGRGSFGGHSLKDG